MDVQFLNQLLEKYRAGSARIYITDASTRILAATEEERVGTVGRTAEYIIGIRRQATIDNGRFTGVDEAANFVTFGTPILENGQLWGAVIVHAPVPLAAQLGNTLQTALETALDYQSYTKEQSATPLDTIDQIAALMLAQTIDMDVLLPLMYRHELEPSLLRTVICIRLHYHKTSYFNISLNLGYQSSIEQLREEVVNRIRHNRYLSTQDLVYMADRNTILIIKSFLPTEDLSRSYLALDVVCRDFADTLNHFSAFSFSIAYGNLYPGVRLTAKSWHEAEETIEAGRQAGKPSPFYSLDTLLFETVCRHLQSQIVNKLLEPALRKLLRKDGSLPMELISCCEAFVDSCMNLSAASARTQLHRNTISARLAKLKNLTGLDPTADFKDAFLLKMLAVYVKQKNENKE
ncbi:PucR family transcriptional regulator [Marasmitruncus massiliensis]|uniref:PucR family transcriptional regulator n=1 Tax=Marasmitruncus massiliensis TaxID=1944642 RepID=UPI000C7CED4F|nr:helix-turn-helix domain-containing protein [Marasmitruncus massiliensis]